MGETPGHPALANATAIVGYTQAFALHGEMPRATIAVLDGGGHIVDIEREAAVQALLSDWLDRLGDC
jgi:pimeloyl-ACP methyl ester carboxylesterase